MIRTDSRYADALLIVHPDTTVSTRRVFPAPTHNFVLYTWLQSDRLDRIAALFLGDPGKWWQIMDANPTIQDPYDIRPGQQIRIPNSV
jgi:LysM domain